MLWRKKMHGIHRSYHYPSHMWLFPTIFVFLAVFSTLQITCREIASMQSQSTPPSSSFLIKSVVDSDSVSWGITMHFHQSWLLQQATIEFISIWIIWCKKINVHWPVCLGHRWCPLSLLLLPTCIWTYYLSPAFDCVVERTLSRPYRAQVVSLQCSSNDSRNGHDFVSF